MKWKCGKCKKIFNRDMRFKLNKLHYRKGYFLSLCEKTWTMAKCTPVKGDKPMKVYKCKCGRWNSKIAKINDTTIKCSKCGNEFEISSQNTHDSNKVLQVATRK